MGLHSNVFLLLSSFFTVLGLLCLFSPSFVIERMLEPKIFSSLTKNLPHILWLVQMLGGSYFIVASLLCTSAAKVTRQMCLSLASGVMTPVLIHVYYALSSNAAMPRTWASYAVTGGHVAAAVGLYVLSNSAADQHAVIRTKKNE